MITRIAPFAAFCIAAACGGGGVPVDSAPPTTDGGIQGETGTGGQTANPFADQFTADPGRTDVIGYQVGTTTDTNETTLVATRGQFTNASGALRLSDGSFLFSAPNGFDTLGRATDGQGSELSLLGSNGFDHVSAYRGVFVNNGVPNAITIGVYGRETASADITTTGTATLVGVAQATTLIEGNDRALRDGTATLTVDFAKGSADLVVNDFSPSLNQRLDDIRVLGMDVQGARFGGGTVEYRLDGALVDPLGANEIANVAGVLAGPVDGNGIPDEAAGVFLGNGDDGFISGSFLVD